MVGGRRMLPCGVGKRAPAPTGVANRGPGVPVGVGNFGPGVPCPEGVFTRASNGVSARVAGGVWVRPMGDGCARRSLLAVRSSPRLSFSGRIGVLLSVYPYPYEGGEEVIFEAI